MFRLVVHAHPSYARPPSPKISQAPSNHSNQQQSQPVFSMPFMPDRAHSYAESSFSAQQQQHHHNTQPQHNYGIPTQGTSPVFPEFDFNPFEDPFHTDATWTHGSHQLKTVDLPFLPISPSTLMNPIPGDHESTEESPQGSFPWMSTPQWEHSDNSALPLSGGTAGGWESGATNSRAPSSGTGPHHKDPSNGVRGRFTKIPKDRGVRHVEEVIEWSAMMRILHAYHAHL